MFHAIAASSLNLNWLDVWYRADKYDYPDHDAKLILKAQQTIQVYGYRFDVATLTDKQTIAEQIARFKGRVKAELGLQL